MSRNFDLLAEIERERAEGKTPDCPKVSKQQTLPNQSALKRYLKKVGPSSAGDGGREEILRLVQNVFLSAKGHAPRQVVFCGVDEESGSSSICASAGRALAAYSSKPVCLVDANLRSPRLSRLCELEKIIPFPAESGSELEYCAQVGGNLWLAGAGLLSDGCGALLSSTELKRRLTQLRSSFEYLLLDGPGLISSGDGAIIGGVVDAAILVVEAGRTRRVIAGKAKDALDAAGIPLLGTILHNRVFPIPEGLYKKI